MIVHVKIGSYTNKGDALMLHAIVNRLSTKADLTVSPLIAEYKKRAVLGLHQTLWFESASYTLNQLITKMSPGFIRRKYGIIADNEINVILDASGFAYGDTWGEKKIRQMAGRAEKWKQQGKKIILLPQSLGPFETPGVRNNFIKLLDNVDLVFARDKTSYRHATGLRWREDIIRQSPDFTGALERKPSNFDSANTRKACIIPNHRMIDSTNNEVKLRYLPFLKECFESFEKMGMDPFILVHEKIDYGVASQLKDMLHKEVTIIYDDNPLALRGVLAQCHIVLSSRFHGLISALSQGIPCLGTRWSHKFESVMEEYKCIDYLVSPLSPSEVVFQKIRELDDPTIRGKVVNNISDTVQKHKILNDQMWCQIEETIGLT